MKTLKIRLIIDTNIIFMALTNPTGKAALILDMANQGKIELYSPESIKKEIINVLSRELELSQGDIFRIIDGLPIIWIEKEIYSEFLDKTKVKHKADKPIEALSLALNCKILSADKHFKHNIFDIEELRLSEKRNGRSGFTMK